MPKARDLLELVRIPGIFTAQADILAGFFIAGATVQRLPAFLLLVMASSCFYSAGMALNDAFDAAIDARQRPGRPIPSGRIREKTAYFVGFGLLLIGLFLSHMAGFTSFLIAALLAAAIVAYDGGVKQLKWLGPVNMGTCRYLNFLLGLSITPVALFSFTIPLLTGIHIFGVTALSRKETEGNDEQGILICAMSLIAVPIVYCSLWLAGVLPCTLGVGLCALWAVLLLGLVAQLARQPSPDNIQRTVKWMLMALVILDGIIVAGACAWPWSLLVWTMLLPAVIISRKFYVT